LAELTEEVVPILDGSGIYVKQLRNGPVYTCRCPVCGTLHGGFRDLQAARCHRKCRRCYASEIEKKKKDIEKVDRKKPQKNIFQHPLNKRAVIEALDDDDDVLKDVSLPDPAPPGTVDKSVCMAARYGQSFYHRATGKRVRVSGRCKTWVTRPDEFQLPVKYGLYTSLYITDRNAHEFTTHGDVGI
jgi:hypothetical protein